MEDEHTRFVICIDYGTTMSGAAWALTKGTVPTLEDVQSVNQWQEVNSPKVKSLYTYAAHHGGTWGYQVRADDPYVIRESKLDLETPKRSVALTKLRSTLEEACHMSFGPSNVLRSEIPRHLIRSASDIVTDYLIDLATAVHEHIGNNCDALLLEECPIDLVITHPAEWDHRARNLTFKAVTNAFRHVFPPTPQNQGVVRLATEPEACAQFTMRVAPANKLRTGECFIVVDAGGGTVDLASYLVEELEPTFRVRKITNVSGGKFGATCIDRYFLHTWLREKLGEEDHDRLLRGSGRGAEQYGRGTHNVLSRDLQILLERFQPFKHAFEGRTPPGHPDNDDMLELVDGVGSNDPERGIQNGMLRIKKTDLEQMFKESVDGTLLLISQQLMQIDSDGLRIKTIFLSGGFSENKYLQRRIRQAVRRLGVDPVQGKESWSAVAQGGVLIGLGLGCDKPAPSRQCPFHIGVVLAERWNEYSHEVAQQYEDTFDKKTRANGNVKWLVAKGDLITEDEGIQVTQPIIRKLSRSKNGKRTGRLTLAFSRVDGINEPRTRLMAEVPNQRWTVDLNYDLSTTPLNPMSAQQNNYLQAEMQLDLAINQRGVNVELVVGRTQGFMGQVGAAGTRLDWRTIDFDP